MSEISLGKKIITSFVITIIAIAVFVGIAMLFGKVGIPLWPFVFFLFFYASIMNFDRSKFWPTAIGGFLGIFVGMSQGIFTQMTGSPTVGFIVFAVFALALVTMFIMGGIPCVNVLTLLLMTLLTVFPSMTPGGWAGFPVGTAGYDIGYIESFIRVICSYALAVILFVVINSIMAKKTVGAQSLMESAKNGESSCAE